MDMGNLAFNRFRAATESDLALDESQEAPSHHLHRPSPISLLTIREREVADAAARGLSNKSIARDLNISPWTVSSHLRQIFTKFGITRRIELALIWHKFAED